MCPGDAPYGAFVAGERRCERVLVAFYFEDLDCLVGRAGCKAAAIVVEDGVMLVVKRQWLVIGVGKRIGPPGA